MGWRMSTGMTKGVLGKTVPCGSFAGLLEDGVLEIYTESRPASADSLQTGNLLLIITKDGGIFTAHNPTNGLNMELSGLDLKRALDGVAPEVWKGLGLEAGTAGWCRFYANDYVRGASTTAVRIDGVVSDTPGAGVDLVMANGTVVAVGVESQVTDVTFNATME